MDIHDVDLEKGPLKMCGRYSGYERRGRYNAFTYDKLYDVPISRNLRVRRQKKKKSSEVCNKVRKWADLCCDTCNIQ